MLTEKEGKQAKLCSASTISSVQRFHPFNDFIR